MDRSQSFDTESVLTSTYSDHRSYQDRNLQNGLIAIQIMKKIYQKLWKEHN